MEQVGAASGSEHHNVDILRLHLPVAGLGVLQQEERAGPLSRQRAPLRGGANSSAAAQHTNSYSQGDGGRRCLSQNGLSLNVYGHSRIFIYPHVFMQSVPLFGIQLSEVVLTSRPTSTAKQRSTRSIFIQACQTCRGYSAGCLCMRSAHLN